MTENTAAPDPSDVLSMMVVSSVFEPRSASIEEKRQIFSKFWASDIRWLTNGFDSAGKERGGDGFGFGFLVEGFARHSARLPCQNTEKGEEIAQTILSAFHLGKKSHFIRMNRRMANSDFLWVKQTGRRVIITGIGEVKSSYRAASKKVGGQLKRQEQSLDFLVKELKSAKLKGTASDLFNKLKVVVSDSLEKFLIVPFGEGDEVRRDEKFSDWQVIELEFSYGELSFIAQQIWPDFRPDIKIGPGNLTNFFEIVNGLGEWVRPRLDSIFRDSEEFGFHNPLPYVELGLFCLATGKTPLLEDEVRWSAELVRESFWPAVQKCLNFFLNSVPRPETDFSEREKRLFKKFWYVLTSDRKELERFTYFIRSLSSQIMDLARENGQSERLKAMSEVWKI